MMRRMLACWMALCVLVLAPPSAANQVKLGLFVGNDVGLAGDPELVFAESDAVKMRDLFVEFGGIKASDAILLQGVGVQGVQREFDKLAAQARSIVSSGHEATFVFYYSGHGDSDGLHINGGRLEFANLRTWLEKTEAQIRIAMVDACQSGGLIRGGARGPSFALAQPTVESAHGTAIVTSSAASELSQESKEIGGGFFTHYLHTALTGAADRNRDGDVSLSEAYGYVHAETAFRTRNTPEVQTPNWDLDLSGAGEIVLTTLEESSARLSFQGDLQGTFGIWDESRRRYVAQVDGGKPITIAVRPGTFFVHQNMPGWVEEAKYFVRRGETHAVLEEDFTSVSYQQAAMRGDLEREFKRSRIPDLSLGVLIGARSFGGSGGDYVTPHAIGGLQAMLLGKRTQYGGFDIRTGTLTTDLVIEGLAPIRTQQTTTSLGAVLGVATRPNLFRTGFGARGVLTSVARRFPEWDIPNQAQGTIGAGFDAWVGLHHKRFTLDLRYNWQFMVVKWDDNRGWPSYGDLTLATGVRF